MKKLLFTSTLLFAAFNGYSQEEMPTIWETKMSHQIEFYGADNAEVTGYGYTADQKEMSIYSNADGSVLWTKKFSDMAPSLRKIDDIITIWEAKKIFLLDLKMGKEAVAVIDMMTGQLEWESAAYKIKMREMITYIPEENGFLFTFKDVNLFVDAESGAEKWSTSKFQGTVGQYIYDNGILTTVNFVPSGLMALLSGFKNQIAQINMKTGEILWENTYVGRADRKIVTKEFLYDLSLQDNQVILNLNGIQVYDYKTGANLWSAAFDYEIPVKAPMNATNFGVYGAVPAPYYTDEHLYMVDISGKSKQFIKKFDRNTGKLIWQSQEISGGARVVPNLYVQDGKVIIQVGGIVEIQGVFKEVEKDPTSGLTTTTYVRKVYDENIKPFGVQAFNDEDGRLAWDSERFKKGITNMYLDEGNLIVCSGKALYSMNVQTGDVNYEVDVKNGGVGDAVRILDYDDMIVVVGEKGVSTFKVKDGGFVGGSKYKRASVVEYFDKTLILETAKNDIAAFDVSDNCKHWAFNARKGAANSLTTDGAYVYVYEKKTVSKLKSRP